MPKWINVRKKRHPALNDTGISKDVLIWPEEFNTWLPGFYVLNDVYEELQNGWHDEHGPRKDVKYWMDPGEPE